MTLSETGIHQISVYYQHAVAEALRKGHGVHLVIYRNGQEKNWPLISCSMTETTPDDASYVSGDQEAV